MARYHLFIFKFRPIQIAITESMIVVHSGYLVWRMPYHRVCN